MNRKDLVAGTLAGFIATAPMSAAMGAMKRFLPWQERYPLPPHLITMQVAERAGVEDDLNRPGRAVATAAGHFGYGALTGTLYGALSRHLPGPPALKGIAYGLGVWTVSYLGLLPLSGLYAPATEQPGRRNALMIAAHVVWGAGLGLITSWLARRQ
jgi:putative membrane protein